VKRKDTGSLASKSKEESTKRSKVMQENRTSSSSLHVPGPGGSAGVLLCRDLCSHHSASVAACSEPATEGSHPLLPSLLSNYQA
jgi:hypothetical protein